jgi:23S rRNA (cytidine1920-2'-O)/16S rRNA (cytidine1409-2'-O)-methyltransferase
MIMAGLVEVDKRPIEKPGTLIPVSSKISLKKRASPYASRGGLKLEAALNRFHLEVKDKVFLDVGASTGGFTDCLLKHGARKVISVDVGYGQLHWRLRQDPRVIVLERTNIRYLRADSLKEDMDGAVIDVSFISLTKVIPPVSRLLPDSASLIALVKPQFEVGKDHVGKGGVVRDEALQRSVVREVIRCSAGLGWDVMGRMASPLLGPKGNREFFVYLRRDGPLPSKDRTGHDLRPLSPESGIPSCRA